MFSLLLVRARALHVPVFRWIQSASLRLIFTAFWHFLPLYALFFCSVLLCVKKAPFIMPFFLYKTRYSFLDFPLKIFCYIYHFPFNLHKCGSYYHFERGRFAKYKKSTSFIAHLQQQAVWHVTTVRFCNWNLLRYTTFEFPIYYKLFAFLDFEVCILHSLRACAW